MLTRLCSAGFAYLDMITIDCFKKTGDDHMSAVGGSLRTRDLDRAARSTDLDETPIV
jgi:hypothetical protein